MLEKMLKLYTMAITADVRSPMPHLIGPPGCGKSTVAQQLADLVGHKLHIINVSRLSPLEIEGVQMPVTEMEQAMKLKLLHSTMWTQLEAGDIVLFDEFLRGFPEVYNGLLDIFTSREVAGFKLPPVFIMGASNSATSYDKALEDRLMHLPVADPRNNKGVRDNMGLLIVEALGLNPKMHKSVEMDDLLTTEVSPMFDVLDSFKGNGTKAGASTREGKSIRNLIGQAKLREVSSTHLETLISMNNTISMNDSKPQFVFLTSGRQAPHAYENAAKKLVGNDKLTPIQAQNLNLNLQLIELERIRTTQKGTTDDPIHEDIFAD